MGLTNPTVTLAPQRAWPCQVSGMANMLAYLPPGTAAAAAAGHSAHSPPRGCPLPAVSPGTVEVPGCFPRASEWSRTGPGSAHSCRSAPAPAAWTRRQTAPWTCDSCPVWQIKSYSPCCITLLLCTVGSPECFPLRGGEEVGIRDHLGWWCGCGKANNQFSPHVEELCLILNFMSFREQTAVNMEKPHTDQEGDHTDCSKRSMFCLSPE